MSRRILLLGAPQQSALKWDESELLDREGCKYMLEAGAEHKSTAWASEWRQLRPPDKDLKPSFLQSTGDIENLLHSFHGDDSFFRTTDVSSVLVSQDARSEASSSLPATVESSEDVLSEFYDHSFAVLEEVPSSQIDAIGNAAAAVDPGLATPSSVPVVTAPPRMGHLSDLEDIPNASYLQSIHPQTMTVNLVVVVMSLPTARIVTTGRRWGREQAAELVELLVGDETKAGFGITLWLSNTADGDEMRSKVRQLCLRDIVLFRNVALSTFRNRVHGQSLRRGITKIDLLYGPRMEVESGSKGAYSARDVHMQTAVTDPQLMKVRRVKDWMETFIGHTYDRHEDACKHSNEASREARNLLLPPDTP
ncbi:hypothetical protein UCRPC4_g03941 [Phaeomoniella chlamydospora]|uniref:Uncharacterized protein n=1 Tax=Phaeomoniella chlamydospora TaxID=158046 RepID=A0A0G2EES1_PHACM|nr:hypothetical protein UCRPC4_g03941 [Phaeomoniella chlamydospora]